MKKVLSFVLVLAMILGSVSLAFATDYKDQAAITNEEAVAVLSELKVLEGDANGFRPTDTLTRAEAAAIIARLILGRTEADKLAAAATQFSDVPASHWAAGYINYCVTEGIIAGNGDGTFAPSGLLTVPAFQKMILCALGYDATREGLVGSGWEAATASLAVKADVTVNATGNCTRETAALLGLKALEADVVEYDQAAITVNAGGASVIVGGSSAKKVAAKDSSTGGTAPEYNGKADGIQQLAEKVYKKDLKKAADADAFGRTANKWTYKGDKIGTYGDVTDADKIYTAKTSETVVKNSYKDADLTATAGAVYVNGVANANGAGNTIALIAALTHNGRTVELYKTDGKVTKVVAYDQFLAKVSAVNTSAEKNTYKMMSGVAKNDTDGVYTLQPTDKGYGTYVKDDYVIVTIASSNNGTTWEVQSVAPATKLTGVIGNVEVENTFYAKAITVDGTSHTAAYHAIRMTKATDKAYDVYTNADGLAFYAPESSVTQDYLVLTANAGQVANSLGKMSTVGQAVLMDGTIQTITIKAGPTAAGIYAYTISSGEYTLTNAGMTYATQALGEDMTNKVSVLNGNHYFNDSTTVYVVKDAGETKAKVTTYAGSQKFTAAGQNVYYVTDKNVAGSATIKTAVIVTAAKVKNSSTGWTFANPNKLTAVGATMVGSNSKSQYEVYVNGVKTVVTAEGAPAAGTFYEPTIDGDGVYTWGAQELDGSNRIANTSIAAAYAGNITMNGFFAGAPNKTVKVSDSVVVIDLRAGLYDDEKMTSFDEIQDYIADHGTLLTASAVYDDKAEVVTYIFLVGGPAQHTF